MFSPVSGVELDSWSLQSEPLLTTIPWNNRKTYFIFYGCGYDLVPLKFSMNFKVLLITLLLFMHAKIRFY